MSEISNKKKKFIQRNFPKLSIEELARKTGLKPGLVRTLVEDYAAEKTRKGRNCSQQKTGDNTLRANRLSYLTGALVIFFITFSIYSPTLTNDFVWDDIKYVVENTAIHSFTSTSLAKMVTSFHAGNWHPLTWLSHAIDYAFWGSNPFGHHLSNIIIHALNTILVFFFCIRLIALARPAGNNSGSTKQVTTILAASVPSLLFGLHPLHVESVAWVAERKDLLCALFFLLALLCYLSFSSSIFQKARRRWYALCLASTLLALLSKPMAVTFPLILLLVDVYPISKGAQW